MKIFKGIVSVNKYNNVSEHSVIIISNCLILYFLLVNE